MKHNNILENNYITEVSSTFLGKAAKRAEMLGYPRQSELFKKQSQTLKTLEDCIAIANQSFAGEITPSILRKDVVDGTKIIVEAIISYTDEKQVRQYSLFRFLYSKGHPSGTGWSLFDIIPENVVEITEGFFQQPTQKQQRILPNGNYITIPGGLRFVSHPTTYNRHLCIEYVIFPMIYNNEFKLLDGVANDLITQVIDDKIEYRKIRLSYGRANATAKCKQIKEVTGINLTPKCLMGASEYQFPEDLYSHRI